METRWITTIEQARKLKIGNKVKQKMHGYIMTVVSIEDSKRLYPTNNFVNVTCRSDDGSTMRHNHKELLLVDEDKTEQ